MDSNKAISKQGNACRHFYIWEAIETDWSIQNILQAKMKSSEITITDQFCGAGGSSEGVKQFATKSKLGNGVKVKLALNHWKLAIETHNTNHPETDHDCTDISACDPRRYPSTHILITSPECTNHSLAKGKKRKEHSGDLFKNGVDPAAERSRATMWDVPRFAEYHRYELIIVENVVDARYWIMWDSWLMAMHSIGYLHECVYMNSMHAHPTPQSRDRMYVVFWKKGNKKPNLAITPLAHCKQCGKDVLSIQSWKNSAKQWGKYRQQYLFRCPTCTAVVEPYYYAAFNCIDWSISGTRIGDRKKPLSENTMKRVQYGINKYWKQPTIITTRYTSGIECRVKGAAEHPLATQPGDQSHAILNPLLVSTMYGSTARAQYKSTGDPMRCQTTTNGLALVSPLITNKEYDTKQQRVKDAIAETGFCQTTHQNAGVVMPFMIKNYGGPPQKPVTMQDAIGTITGSDHHGLVNMPLIDEHQRNGKTEPATRELATILAGGNHHGLIASDSWRSFLSYYYGGSDMASHIAEPTRTFRAGDTASLINVGEIPRIEDCYYRMLLPHEVKLGMAFDESYIVLGSGKDQVKQLGNAVTPPVMELLVERCIQTLL